MIPDLRSFLGVMRSWRSVVGRSFFEVDIKGHVDFRGKKPLSTIIHAASIRGSGLYYIILLIGLSISLHNSYRCTYLRYTAQAVHNWETI